MTKSTFFPFFKMTFSHLEVCGKWSVTWLNRFQSPTLLSWMIFWSLLKGIWDCTAGRQKNRELKLSLQLFSRLYNEMCYLLFPWLWCCVDIVCPIPDIQIPQIGVHFHLNKRNKQMRKTKKTKMRNNVWKQSGKENYCTVWHRCLIFLDTVFIDS